MSNPLTPVQGQVLALLASGNTAAAAAEQTGVHRNTISSWRRSSAPFRAEWEALEREQALHWRGEMQSLARLAVEVVQKSMVDRESPWSVRLRAALAVLEKVAALPALPADPEPPAITLVPPAQPSAPPDPPRPAPAVVQPSRPPESAQSRTTSRPSAVRQAGQQPARNALCPCGSGLKFKRCCLEKTMAA